MRYLRPIFFLTIFLFTFIFTQNKIFAQEPILRCQPSTGSFRVGDNFYVDYELDTGGQDTTGAEIVATYDNQLLDAVVTLSTVISAKTGWTQPLTNTVDSQLGKIILDFGDSQKVYNGKTSVGKILFKAKNPGQAHFDFSFFEPNDMTTPAVAKIWQKEGTRSANILTNVENCLYTIEGSNVSLTPSPTLQVGAPIQPTSVSTLTQLPRAGSLSNTIVLIFAAIFMTVVGFTGLGVFLWKEDKL